MIYMVTDVITLPSPIAEGIRVVNCGGGRVRMRSSMLAIALVGKGIRVGINLREKPGSRLGATTCCGRSKLRRR